MFKIPRTCEQGVHIDDVFGQAAFVEGNDVTDKKRGAVHLTGQVETKRLEEVTLQDFQQHACEIIKNEITLYSVTKNKIVIRGGGRVDDFEDHNLFDAYLVLSEINGYVANERVNFSVVNY